MHNAFLSRYSEHNKEYVKITAGATFLPCERVARVSVVATVTASEKSIHNNKLVLQVIKNNHFHTFRTIIALRSSLWSFYQTTRRLCTICAQSNYITRGRRPTSAYCWREKEGAPYTVQYSTPGLERKTIGNWVYYRPNECSANDCLVKQATKCRQWQQRQFGELQL